MKIFSFILLLAIPTFSFSADGVYKDRIVIGSVMDLEGQSRGLGQGMRSGLMAAFKNQKVQGRSIELFAVNDSYTPELTIKQTESLAKKDIFVMIGNVGTPTAKVALPILADNQIPAVGFFTGAGLLRPGVGDVINYRASYVQEVAVVIEQSLRNGLLPKQICAFVQNDAYGMSGVEGIKQALSKAPRTREIIKKLDQVLAFEGENPQRNGIGPVGVYQRNTLTSKGGFDSLKQWEDSQQTQCKLVVTVGAYSAIGRFAAYSRYKNEDWLISAVSFTGADNLRSVLGEFSVEDRVIMTQVVPDLNAPLEIIKQAKKALGQEFSYVTLEGYITGKMFLEIARQIDGPITRQSFLDAADNFTANLGGINLDFIGDNQGSDLVTLTYFDQKGYQPMNAQLWQQLF